MILMNIKINGIDISWTFGENTIKIINLVKSNPTLSCGPVKDGFIHSRNRFPEDFEDKTGINVHIQQSGNTQQS